MPPPTTTASRASRARRTMSTASVMSSSLTTPSRSAPGMAGLMAAAPVASSRRSYCRRRPLCERDEPGRGVEVGGALGDECQAERAGLLRGEREEPPPRQLAGQVVRQAGARVVAVRIGADDHELGAGVCPPDDLGRGHGARSGADEDVPCGHVSRLRRRGARPAADRLEAQEAPRAALHALAAGEAAAVPDGLVAPHVAPHVDAHRAVERAHAALYAAAGLRRDPLRRETRVARSVCLEPAHSIHLRRGTART